MFLNSDNETFQKVINSEIYADKTGLLEYTNRVIDTEQSCICNSRPRRFGKSVTANMLTAYYSRGCNSESLFSECSLTSPANFAPSLASQSRK